MLSEWLGAWPMSSFVRQGRVLCRIQCGPLDRAPDSGARQLPSHVRRLADVFSFDAGSACGGNQADRAEMTDVHVVHAHMEPTQYAHPPEKDTQQHSRRVSELAFDNEMFTLMLVLQPV